MEIEKLVRSSWQIIENHHILPVDRQILGNGQVNLTGSLRPITYKLRMDRDWEWSGQVDRSLKTITYSLRLGNGQVNYGIIEITYPLRMDRDWGMVKSAWPNHSHTCWGWTDIVKWSNQLDRIIEKHHLLPGNGQRLENDQVNLTGSLRIITYILRIDRD